VVDPSAAPRLPDSLRDIPTLRNADGMFTTTANPGSLANAASGTIDFSAALRSLTQTREERRVRWRIAYVYAVADAGTGGFVFDQWLAGDEDLSQNLANRSQIMPLNALLPLWWDGPLTVRATNRSGATATCQLTLWLAPGVTR
jgi:hypothetical protein